MQNHAEWNALTEDEKQQQQKVLEDNKRDAKHSSSLCIETLHMFNYLTIDEVIRTPFLMSELLPRFTSMLLNVIAHLVGKKSMEIKVDNMESYGFDPKRMLQEVCQAIVHFAGFEVYHTQYSITEPLTPTTQQIIACTFSHLTYSTTTTPRVHTHSQPSPLPLSLPLNPSNTLLFTPSSPSNPIQVFHQAIPGNAFYEDGKPLRKATDTCSKFNLISPDERNAMLGTLLVVLPMEQFQSNTFCITYHFIPHLKHRFTHPSTIFTLALSRTLARSFHHRFLHTLLLSPRYCDAITM